MARPLRIQFAGALYHVVSRGNEGRAITRDDKDRKERLDWLRRTVATYGWQLHAFALMRSYEHLFVETPDANLSAGMQYLNGSYTGYFNRRHRRAGHLFQGRFKGHVVEEQGHFLEVSRYVHRIPLRLKDVTQLNEYLWSSYPGYCRARQALDWVCYERVLGEVQGALSKARWAYQEFVCEGSGGRSPFADAVGGLLVGSAEFVGRMRRLLDGRPGDQEVPQLKLLLRRPSLETIVRTVSEHFGSDSREWKVGSRDEGPGRALAAYLARRDYGYGAQEVAEEVGYRSHGSVRAAVLRIERGDPALKRHLQGLRSQLSE